MYYLKQIVFTVVFLISFNLLFSQAIPLKWIKQFGTLDYDVLTDLSVDNNNDVIFSGYFPKSTTIDNYNIDSASCFIAKCDNSGNIKWVYQNDRTNGFNWSPHLCTTTDNSIYASGNFNNTISINDDTIISNTDDNIITVKFNSNGEIIWHKEIFSLYNYISINLRVIDISSDNNGDVYILSSISRGLCIEGDTVSISPNTFYIPDYVLVKYDSAGNYQWNKIIRNKIDYQIGFINNDDYGNTYLSCIYKDSIQFDNQKLFTNGGQGVFIGKINKNGNLVKYILAEAVWPSHKFRTKVINNSVLFVNTFYDEINVDSITFASTTSLFIAELDTNLSIKKSKILGNRADGCKPDITKAADNNYYVLFHHYPKYNPVIDNDTLIKIGEDHVAFIVKLNSNMDYIDYSCIGGPYNAFIRNFEITNSGSIYGLGCFADSTIFYNDTIRTKGFSDIVLMYFENIKSIFNNKTPIFLYPNPSNDFLNIEFSKTINTQIKVNIYDSNGRLISISTHVPSNNQIQIKVKNLNSGVYFLSIFDGEQQSSGKFVKY